MLVVADRLEAARPDDASAQTTPRFAPRRGLQAVRKISVLASAEAIDLTEQAKPLSLTEKAGAIAAVPATASVGQEDPKTLPPTRTPEPQEPMGLTTLSSFSVLTSPLVEFPPIGV